DVVAMQYFTERFGFDPLNVTGKSYMVKARPFSAEAFNDLEDMPELREHFDYTLMAFLPEGDNPDFYGPAWQEQFEGSDPARQRVTPDMGRQLINRQKGAMAYSLMTTVYDEALEQAKGVYADSPNQLKEYRKELARWKFEQAQDISVEYFAWGNDKEIAGAIQRPTYQQLYDEIMNVTLDGPARALAMKMNPELVGFLDRAQELAEQLEQHSLDLGHNIDWWRSASGGVENREEKRAVHEWYLNGLQYEIDQFTNEDSIASSSWMLERIFTKLVEGVEFDDEVVLPPVEPP
ncbi:unnamed protein product, partial [marine sediment metagenome]